MLPNSRERMFDDDGGRPKNVDDPSASLGMTGKSIMELAVANPSKSVLLKTLRTLNDRFHLPQMIQIMPGVHADNMRHSFLAAFLVSAVVIPQLFRYRLQQR